MPLLVSSLVSSLVSPPVSLSTFLTVLADPSPKPEDVKAGWTAFALFILLLLAVVLLGLSLFKHLRRVEAAKEAGVYGPVDDEPTDHTTGSRPS